MGGALEGEEKTFVKDEKLLESWKVRLRSGGQGEANRSNAALESRNRQRVTAVRGSRAWQAGAKGAQGNADTTTRTRGDSEGA